MDGPVGKHRGRPAGIGVGKLRAGGRPERQGVPTGVPISGEQLVRLVRLGVDGATSMEDAVFESKSGSGQGKVGNSSSNGARATALSAAIDKYLGSGSEPWRSWPGVHTMTSFELQSPLAQKKRTGAPSTSYSPQAILRMRSALAR